MTLTRTYNSIVLVKQVPDTHNIHGDVMKEDGTINRSALPAIFNPGRFERAGNGAASSRNATAAQVTVVTMGPRRRRRCCAKRSIAARIALCC